jgi:hypothetical protein
MTAKNYSNNKTILDLGLQPVSNRFIQSSSRETIPKYPIKVKLDTLNGTVFLDPTFPVEEIKPRHKWLTCFEPEDHLDNMVEKIISLPNVNNNLIFAGYSFKDDSTLDRLRARGYKNQWRIDPQKDLSIIDRSASIETFQSVFNLDKAKKIRQQRGSVDVMIVRHVVEHAYDLPQFVAAISEMIHEDGYIIWELPDCERALEKGDCTTIWEEHLHYFTSFTFNNMLINSGFAIIHNESVSYPLENSLIVITKKNTENKTCFIPNQDVLNTECERAYQFANKVTERKKKIQLIVRKLKQSNGSIALFGAGHLSVAFISIMDISDEIDFVIDDNPNKHNMLMPVGDIKILGSDSLYSKNINLCLLGLNPQNQPKLIARHAEFIEIGGRFASIFPETILDLEKMI